MTENKDYNWLLGIINFDIIKNEFTYICKKLVLDYTEIPENIIFIRLDDVLIKFRFRFVNHYDLYGINYEVFYLKRDNSPYHEGYINLKSLFGKLYKIGDKIDEADINYATSAICTKLKLYSNSEY